MPSKLILLRINFLYKITWNNIFPQTWGSCLVGQQKLVSKKQIIPVYWEFNYLETFIVADATFYSPSGHDYIRHSQFLMSLDMHKFTICVMWCRVTCYICIIVPLIYFVLFPFLFHCCINLEIDSVATVSISLVISSSSYGYHYAKSLCLLFEGPWLPLSFGVTWLGSMYDADIALKDFRQLCYVEWISIYLVIWLYLDNSTTKAYVIEMEGFLFCFQTSLLHIESGKHAHCYYLPISVWKPVIYFREG